LTTRSDGIQASSFRPRTDFMPGETVWSPEGAAFRTQTTDRERIGTALAAQWRSLDDSKLATFQFLRSEASVSWTEFASEIATDNVGDEAFFAIPGTEIGFGGDGVFTHGVITAETGWRDDRPGERRAPPYGLQSNNIRRDVEQTYITADYGLNFKWKPNEAWSINLDYQHVKSTVENVDFGIWSSTYQNADIDLRGRLPRVTFLPPS